MSVKDRWEEVSPDTWQSLAENWLNEIRVENSTDESEFTDKVVFMNLTAPPKLQWEFILITLSLAETDEELAAIAAGPIEYLLGFFGKKFIELVEKQAATDPKFQRTLSGLWGERAIDSEIRLRVKKLEEQVSEPIGLDFQRKAHDKRLSAEKLSLERLDEENRRRSENKSQRPEND